MTNTSVKKYPRYKDSGIPWIGEIPEGWNVKKVKSAFTRKKDTCNNANPIILSLTSKGVKFRDITTNEGQIAASYENYNPVLKGDILLNPMDLVTNAFSAVSDKEGVISPAYVNLRARDGYFNKYYDYYFKLQYWGLSFFAHGKGVSFENRWTLNNETLMNYFIPVPQYSEQKAIADYLDEKCGAIDKTIETEEKVIEKLKEYKQSLITETVTKGLDKSAPMKDSGIPWIGQIPQDWILSPLHSVIKEITTKNTMGMENTALQFRYGSIVKKSNFDTKEDDYVADTIKNYTIVYPGVLVLNGLNLNYDFVTKRVALVKMKGAITSAYITFTSKDTHDLLPEFVEYLLKSYDAQMVFHGMGVGIRKTLTFNQLKKLPMIYPAATKQKEIVNYLDKKCAKIDKAIANKEQVIEKLTEYKKSLIYECVTGKRMVA